MSLRSKLHAYTIAEGTDCKCRHHNMTTDYDSKDVIKLTECVVLQRSGVNISETVDVCRLHSFLMGLLVMFRNVGYNVVGR